MNNSGYVPPPPALPESAQLILNQVLGAEFLGASRNIRQINDCFVAASREWTGSAEELVAALLATGEYLIATRGKNTPAIGNAVSLALKNLRQAAAPTLGDVQELMEAHQTEYNTASLRNIELMAEYGANILANCDTILPFDYSSSMMAILKRLADRGRRARLIIPESRCLDGGRPIAAEATVLGHSVVFIVDMAFSHFLREIGAVLIGAETIFANGDCWNTIGSYPIAVLAEKYQIPYYVATELIKIDPGSFAGLQKPIKPQDYSEILNYPGTFQQPELISVTAPDLDRVPASLITAYITPGGVMPPGQLWNESWKFLESVGASALSSSSTL